MYTINSAMITPVTHKNEFKRLLGEKIRAHNLQEASTMAEEAMGTDLHSMEEIVATIKYLTYWIDRHEQLDKMENLVEQGELFTELWKDFQVFVQQIAENSSLCYYALQYHVFTKAIECFRKVYEVNKEYDPNLLTRIARCYRSIGKYQHAVRFYRLCLKTELQDAMLLAELADTYAMLDELTKAKVFFREAFAINPRDIDLSQLESNLITRLVTKIAEIGHTGEELNEWIPFYGTIWQVFTVKRELRPLEMVEMRQKIIQLEQEYTEDEKNRNMILPRLLNLYLRLIDHYSLQSEENYRVNELLLKIKKINPELHKQYIQ